MWLGLLNNSQGVKDRLVAGEACMGFGGIWNIFSKMRKLEYFKWVLKNQTIEFGWLVAIETRKNGVSEVFRQRGTISK